MRCRHPSCHDCLVSFRCLYCSAFPLTSGAWLLSRLSAFRAVSAVSASSRSSAMCIPPTTFLWNDEPEWRSVSSKSYKSNTHKDFMREQESTSFTWFRFLSVTFCRFEWDCCDARALHGQEKKKRQRRGKDIKRRGMEKCRNTILHLIIICFCYDIQIGLLGKIKAVTVTAT